MTLCGRRSPDIFRQRPSRLKAALAMLGARAALTRHGRCQARQRWIDAKASSSSSLWAVAVVRHDKIASVVAERICCTSSVPRMHTVRYPNRRRRFQRPISYRELADEILGAVWLEVAVCKPSSGARLAV